MKKILTIMALFALSFATGFTCSKNAPEQAAQPAATSVNETSQAQMAAPADPQAPVEQQTQGDSTAQPATAPTPTETK